MFNRITGDSIEFQLILKDNGGTAITNGTGTLNVFASGGSQVVTNSVATHFGTGTYQKQASSTGWPKGPVIEQWKFVGAFGTLSFVQNNTYRIVGTDTVEPYIYPEELRNYLENIEDYFDGNEEAIVVDSFWEVNSRLGGLGQKLPIKAKADGFFDQPLRDLNAYEALFRIVGKRQSSFRKDGDDDPWFFSFKKEAERIYKAIDKKIYSFDNQYDPGEGGVGLATKVAGTSEGRMETNWRDGVGTGFIDDSFERDWVVKMTGTGTAGEVGECPFIWSNNGGISFDGTGTSTFDWQGLKDGVHIRFHRGTYESGSINLFATNDKWKFKTFPRNQTVGGVRSARSY